MSLSSWADAKTTNSSYWPLVSGIPAWRLSSGSPNVWNDLIDAIAAWAGDVNANGKNLSNVGTLTFGTGGAIAAPAWNALTLVNGWVNYGGAYQVAQYTRNAVGNVMLRGTIKSGTYADGTLLFTLPAGFRPPAAVVVPLASGSAGAVPPQLIINADGTCIIYGLAGNSSLHITCVFPVF